MKKYPLIALTAAAALVLSGCADLNDDASGSLDPAALGSADVQQKMDELYQQAISDNELAVVTYGPGEETYAGAYRKFMERYPEIRVENEYIFGAELSARLDQEFASGKRIGSIQNGGPALTFLTYNAERCMGYEPFAITDEEIGLDNVSPDKEYRAFSVFPFGIAYNTDEVTEDEAPTSFTELADDVWKDRLLVSDPLRVNGFTNSVAAMLDSGEFTTDWLEGVASNNPMTTSTSALAAQSIARGERGVDVMGQFNQYQDLIADGLPVKFVFPTEDAIRAEFHYTCMLKDAPAQAATELLYNWLYTPEGQDALAIGGVYGVRAGSASPEGMPDLDPLRDQMMANVPVPEAAQVVQDLIAKNQEIFK